MDFSDIGIGIGMNFRLGIGIWYRYRYEFWVSVSGIGIGLNFGYRYRYRYRYGSSAGYRYRYRYRYQGIGGTLLFPLMPLRNSGFHQGVPCFLGTRLSLEQDREGRRKSILFAEYLELVGPSG